MEGKPQGNIITTLIKKAGFFIPREGYLVELFNKARCINKNKIHIVFVVETRQACIGLWSHKYFLNHKTVCMKRSYKDKIILQSQSKICLSGDREEIMTFHQYIAPKR